jgi:hypothetical protein
MRERFFSLLFAGLTATLAGLAPIACSTGTNGQGPNPDASPADATSESIDGPSELDASTEADTAPVEAAVEAGDDGSDGAGCNSSNCGGACCGDLCVPRTCAGCSVGPLFCPFLAGVPGVNGYCVSDCSSCNAGGVKADIACFTCQGGTTTEQCSTSASDCPTAVDAGACACATGDASDCPGKTQVCGSDMACLTCGQPGTASAKCANGHGCDEDAGMCNK